MLFQKKGGRRKGKRGDSHVTENKSSCIKSKFSSFQAVHSTGPYTGRGHNSKNVSGELQFCSITTHIQHQLYLEFKVLVWTALFHVLPKRFRVSMQNCWINFCRLTHKNKRLCQMKLPQKSRVWKQRKQGNYQMPSQKVS